MTARKTAQNAEDQAAAEAKQAANEEAQRIAQQDAALAAGVPAHGVHDASAGYAGAGTAAGHADLSGEDAQARSQKLDKRLRVLAPYVWYRRLVPRDDEPDKYRVVEQQAFQGQIIAGDNLFKGERERLIGLGGDDPTPHVEELDDDAPDILPVPPRMVGIGTGVADVKALAKLEAVKRTRQQLVQNFHPDDPEYEITASGPLPARASVETGPGGYVPDRALDSEAASQ